MSNVTRVPNRATTRDGRALRSARSRDAVVTALLSLYADGRLRPGAAEIAARAGVSQSSVFRHFKDLEALVEAAIEAQWARVGAKYAPPPATGSRAARIDALLEQRLGLHHAVANTTRAARIDVPESPTFRRMLALRRAVLRDQVAVQFSTELDARGPDERTRLLDALDAACSLEQVEFLRVDRGLTRADARATMSLTLTALLRKGS